jgi:hypothetical protein
MRRRRRRRKRRGEEGRWSMVMMEKGERETTKREGGVIKNNKSWLYSLMSFGDDWAGGGRELKSSKRVLRFGMELRTRRDTNAFCASSKLWKKTRRRVRTRKEPQIPPPHEMGQWAIPPLRKDFVSPLLEFLSPHVSSQEEGVAYVEGHLGSCVPTRQPATLPQQLLVQIQCSSRRRRVGGRCVCEMAGGEEEREERHVPKERKKKQNPSKEERKRRQTDFFYFWSNCFVGKTVLVQRCLLRSTFSLSLSLSTQKTLSLTIPPAASRKWGVREGVWRCQSVRTTHRESGQHASPNEGERPQTHTPQSAPLFFLSRGDGNSFPFSRFLLFESFLSLSLFLR